MNRLLPPWLVLAGFAVLMVAAAVRMLRDYPSPAATAPYPAAG